MKQCKECNKPCKKTYCSDECVAAKKHRNAHTTVVCKECKKPFECKRENANGKVYCSNECRQANGAKKPFGRTIRTFVCCSCGKQCTRDVRNDTDQWTCGIECQRKKGWIEIDWKKRSTKAKAKWKKENRYKKKGKSLTYLWLRKARRSIQRPLESDWLRRSRSASSMLSHRLNPSAKIVRVSDGWTWSKIAEVSLHRTEAKTKRNKQCEWTKKATTVSGTLRRRRGLLNAKKPTCLHIAG